MAKYSKKLALMMAEKYGSGEVGVKELCETVGISQETFYAWKKTKAEFSEAIEHFHGLRLENLSRMALSGLALLVTKYDYEEVEETYEKVPGKDGAPAKMVQKGVKKTKKFVMPNAKMIEYALNNRNPMEWKTASKVDVTSDGKALSFAGFLMQTMPTGAEIPEVKVSEDGTEVEEVYVPDHRE